MGISNGTHHVIRFSSGEIWYFSFSPNRGIMVQQLDRNSTWKQSYELISNAQEDFSVSIDNQDRLHLICFSKKGELQYLLYNDTGWSKQVLSVYKPTRYTIRYPVVIPIKNRIHILFAIGKAFNTGYWSLQHYYWDETSWHSTEITKVTAGYRLSPFYVDMSDKHIHLVYRGLTTNRYQIFYSRYHLDHGIWSTPENVTYDSIDCNMPSILIRDDLLHLAWTSLSKNDLVVKYKNRTVRSLGKMDWSPEIQLNNPGSTATLPRLIWLEEKIWCIWYQNDTLYCSSSEDRGLKWSTPAELQTRYGTSFQYIHYSTNHPRDKRLFQLQWILGNVEETLSLPLVESYMDLPEYIPNAPATDWHEDIIRPSIDQTDDSPKAESVDNHVDVKETSAIEPPAPTEKNRTVPNVRAALESRTMPGIPGAHQSLENILLNEFERQEEFNYSLITKLDEHSRIGSSVLEDSRQIITLLKENKEMLQALKKDMEQVKQDTRQLKARGLLRRLFHNGY
ncbi:MAG: hypothetical protein ACOYEH_03825 [Caldicoprobacterales bacterium]|jgi:hypothetical protein